VSATDDDMRDPVRKFQERYRRKFKRMARGMSNRAVMITLAPVFDMLDSRFGEAVAQLLRVFYASATGAAERQDCFVCLQPWTPARAAVVIGAAEFVKKSGKSAGHALMFAICDECCGDQRALSAALERDFGEFKMICSKAGTA
jgi:hypothetical protein